MKKRKLVLPIISLLVIVIISFIHSYGGNKSHGIKNSNALTIESSLEIVEENELLKEYIEDTKDFSTLSTNEVLKKIENN